MSDHLPPPRHFFDALLRVLAEHPEGVARRDLYDPVADRVGLASELREVWVRGGKMLGYKDRIGWAFNTLRRAGLAELSGRVCTITEPGRSLVESRPNKLSEADLERIVSRPRPGDIEADAPSDLNETTPNEQIDRAMAIIQRDIMRDLLENIARCSPVFFETLVLDLLHAMGYGTERDDLQRVGGSGDGGIDGVISLDKLGLEKVYIQAKRWKNTVGRPEIQGFYGALAGRRARKGVFITTSNYSREATEFVESVSDSIVLVDGRRLAQLMIDHGVGVHRDRTIHIPTLDSDYFDDV